MSGAPTPVAGTEEQPHARLVLAGALAAGAPSHAYLFHGPPGAGKRTAARAFAAELLAAASADPESARRRALSGSHTDLTWVRPTGAHEMLVADVDGPVIAAAGLTPLEGGRRVFVLERADTMSDQVANRLLKTLEEPAPYAHLILVTDALARVLPTVVSRCQPVRFDALPAATIERRLLDGGTDPERARAVARLSLGDAGAADALAAEDGVALRADVDGFVRAALAGDDEAGAPEPWRPLLDRAEERRHLAEEQLAAEAAERLDLEPRGRARSALEREFGDAARRGGRRALTAELDLALRLAGLAFRDLACAAEGAEEAVLGTDAIAGLASVARGRDPRRLRAALEACEHTRLSLRQSVEEQLALSALELRLRELVGVAG